MDLWELLGTRPDTREFFAVTAWHLWTRRNKKRLNQNISPLHQVPSEAHHYLAEYKKHNSTPVKQPKPRSGRWIPPDKNHLKTNFDGTFLKENGAAGIVRDRAPGPFLWDVGPNPHEWVESCYCLSKWRFD